MKNKNVCKLCFSSQTEIIQFFSDEGIELNIQSNDNLPIGICRNCWKHVKEFNSFYENIEYIHKNQECDNELENDYESKFINNKNAADKHSKNESDNESIIKSEFVDFTFINEPLEPTLFIKLESTANLDTNNELNNKNTIYPNEEVGKGLIGVNKKRKITKTKDAVVNKAKTNRQSIENISEKTDIIDITCINTESNSSNQRNDINEINLNSEHNCNEVVASNIDNDNEQNLPIQNKPSKTSRRDEEDIKIAEFFNLNCEICWAKHSTISEIFVHYRRDHNIKNGFVTCCKKKLFNRSAVLNHMYWHSNPNEFKCNICNKSYKDKFRLKIHLLNIHAAQGDPKYYCDMCGASFTIRELLMKHFRNKHLTNTSIKTFKCDQCNKSFINNTKLHNHIRCVHQCTDGYICPICARIYKSKGQCDSHYLQHLDENIPKAKLQCQLCGTFLKNEHNLKCHLRRTHNGIPKTCKLCGKVAPNSNALRSHISAVHSERIHKCNLCDKAFKRAIGLKEHMASHTGNSILYTCPYCPITFNSNANMHSHRKKKHPAEWLQTRCQRIGNITDNS